MLEHGISGDVAGLPGDVVPLLQHPVVEVVVLAAPPVEGVGEAVDAAELLGAERRHPAEVPVVDQAVLPLVHRHGKVLRLVRRALVQVPEEKP